jgi:hypothetical protein
MDTNDQLEKSPAGLYTDAVLTEEFQGLQAGTEIRIYPPRNGSGYSLVSTENGQEFRIYPAPDGSESAKIVTMRGHEFTINRRALPAVTGKKYVIPRLEENMFTLPDKLKLDVKVGRTVILEAPGEGKHAVIATTLDGIQFTVTREIAEMMYSQ